MKFTVFAVTAIHLGKCVNASPIKDLTEEIEINGWWEHKTSASLKDRDVSPGKTFTLTQVKNSNYNDPGVPFDLLKAYAKYHTKPPDSLKEAVKTNSKLKKGEEKKIHSLL